MPIGAMGWMITMPMITNSQSPIARFSVTARLPAGVVSAGMVRWTDLSIQECPCAGHHRTFLAGRKLSFGEAHSKCHGSPQRARLPRQASHGGQDRKSVV